MKKTLEIYINPSFMEDESRSVEGMFPLSKPQQIPQNLFCSTKRLGFWCWWGSRIYMGYRMDKCWNSEHWCRFNWVILGNLSQIWFHMVSCIFPSLPSQDSSLSKRRAQKRRFISCKSHSYASGEMMFPLFLKNLFSGYMNIYFPIVKFPEYGGWLPWN